ncbi:MAG: TlpA disulfide reductase family protein [Planctomycetota bacterium]
MRAIRWMTAVLMLGAAAWAGDLAGTPAVELDATEWINSPPLTLAVLAGRPAVIYLWASMHPDCRKNAAMLNEAFQAYKGRQIALVALTAESNGERVRAFLTEQGAAYPVGIGSQAQSRYNVPSLPFFIVIGGDGQVRYAGPELPPLSEVTALAPPPAVTAGKEPGASAGEAAAWLDLAAHDLAPALAGIDKGKVLLDGLLYLAKGHLDDPVISARVIKFAGAFLTGAPEPAIRQQAAGILALYPDNAAALEALMNALAGLAGKDAGFLVLQCRVVNALSVVGRYDPRTAHALFGVFEGPYGADIQLLGQALRALGKVRTCALVDCLVRAIAKPAPVPEDLNSDFLIPIRNRACFSEKGLALFPTHR